MMPDREFRARLGALSVLAVALLYAGLLIGVSALATPAKFLAPSLSLPVALDVGRHTFALFNTVEWIMAVGLAAAVLATRGPGALAAAAAAIVLGLVLADTVWLLPVLDRRVGVILAGGQLPPSNLHVLYIALDAVKLAALLAAAWCGARRLLRAGPAR